MIKTRKGRGSASVTFTLDPGVGAQTAAVCGEWNDWSAGADVMDRDAEGGFSLTVALDAGRAYRFRYLLDDQRWENDWAADAYLPNSFGGDDSVVDLTALVQAAPPTAKKASTEKEPAKATRKAAAATAKPARKTVKPARKAK
jgi:1,4-alpha-glucan branching enzyme